MPYNAGSAIQRVTLVNAATDTDITPSAGTAADPSAVVGNVASGATDSGNPVKFGAVYRATLPTLTDGWRGDALLTSRGALFMAMSGLAQGLANGLSAVVNPYTNSSLGGAGPMGALQYVYNGSTIDMRSKPNAASRIPSSANSTNATSAKASAGNVFQVNGYNSSATVTYLKLYNKASAPTVGTDTPYVTLALPALTPFAFTFDSLYFSTGIAYGLTTDAADAGTTAVAAGAILGLNLVYS